MLGVSFFFIRSQMHKHVFEWIIIKLTVAQNNVRAFVMIHVIWEQQNCIPLGILVLICSLLHIPFSSLFQLNIGKKKNKLKLGKCYRWLNWISHPTIMFHLFIFYLNVCIFSSSHKRFICPFSILSTKYKIIQLLFRLSFFFGKNQIASNQQFAR